jgi:hypothetical protein
MSRTVSFIPAGEQCVRGAAGKRLDKKRRYNDNLLPVKLPRSGVAWALLFPDVPQGASDPSRPAHHTMPSDDTGLSALPLPGFKLRRLSTISLSTTEDSLPMLALPAPQSSRCRVSEKARELLRSSPHAAVRGVACAFHDGQLILRGKLRTFFHKQIAQEAVSRLEGVCQVVNQIEVVQLAA